ncbi:MAG: hypothetical protein Q4B85_02930 [Lachnospiraceae bacterium]|nr:hypothetical protein [Lachnospiraceae bacterium]
MNIPKLLPGNPVQAVFMAEPVSDVIAAAATTITFLTAFRRILKSMEG